MRISDWSSYVCASDLPSVSRKTPPRRAQGFYGINRFVLSRRSERVRDGITTVAAEIARAQLHPRRSLATFIFGDIQQALYAGDGFFLKSACDQLWNGQFFLHQTIKDRSEEHTSELQSLMRISYAV